MKLLLIAPLAVTVLASSATAATLIAGSGMTVTASSINTAGYGQPAAVVNGTGLSAGVHSTANAGQWYTVNGGGDSNAWIAFDLGVTVALDSIHVWNASSLPLLGIKTLDIYVSSVVSSPGDPEIAGAGNALNWTKIGDNVTFTQAPASNNTGFDLETATGITLPGTAVRHVRFESDSNWGNTTNYVGLSEVQFFSVPEPSAALLGGLGMLALLRRRRN